MLKLILSFFNKTNILIIIEIIKKLKTSYLLFAEI